MPTIALTGASGFVGTQILRQLEAAGNRVVAFVRNSDAAAANASGQSTSFVHSDDLFSEPVDKLGRHLRDVDTLIHCAWYAEPGKYLESPLNLDCLAGTLRLAEAFMAAGGRRFVGIGTCFEYDLGQSMLSISTPLRPNTLYAACKASASQILEQMFKARNLEFAWCRLFYLYGEGEDPRRLVSYIHQQLGQGLPAELSSGNQIRDYLDVRKAGCMIAEVALGQVRGPVNICSGIPMSVRQLAEAIADRYGRRDLLRFGARPDNLLDPPCVVGIKEFNLHE